MYYIYHIPGVKIGCSKEPEKRIADQGYTDYEILEQHDDPQIAGDRERELQKEYGYPVDHSHYAASLANRSAMGKAAGRKAKESGQFIEFARAGGEAYGPIQGRKNVESGHLASITPKSGSLEAKRRNELRQKLMKERGTHNSQKEHTCPHCNKIGKGNMMFRWHFDNCKKRDLNVNLT